MIAASRRKGLPQADPGTLARPRSRALAARVTPVAFFTIVPLAIWLYSSRSTEQIFARVRSTRAMTQTMV
jgi:hypothetical protein